jgi:NAD(P)-dependent dehydrogenase (short-subunit alcohol dehydrogenase family)
VLTARFTFDGVVNNVGLVRPQRLGELELSALEEVLRANLHPALQAVQAILPGMKTAAGAGSSTSPASPSSMPSSGRLTPPPTGAGQLHPQLGA